MERGGERQNETERNRETGRQREKYRGDRKTGRETKTGETEMTEGDRERHNREKNIFSSLSLYFGLLLFWMMPVQISDCLGYQLKCQSRTYTGS